MRLARTAPIVIVVALVLSGCQSSSDTRTNDRGATDGHIVRETATGGFVNRTNLHAMEQWAHSMCAGLKLARTARNLGVQPTIAAVTGSLIGNDSSDARIRRVTRRICEAELRQANHSP